MSSFNFKGRRIFITGSTRGIGREIAQSFLDAGAEVIVHGSSMETAGKAAGTLDVSFVAADLSIEKEVDSLVKQLSSDYDSLDVLINNAGFEWRETMESFPLEMFDKIYRVNLRSPVQITQGLFPLLTRGQFPVVINMSSVHEFLAYPTNTPYAMMKSALKTFTENLAVEWAPYGIRVNNVAPGAILTDMNREIIENIGKKTFAQWIPAGRVGYVSEVAKACLFLASDMCPYLTGTSIVIDGGLSKGLLPYGRTKAMDEMADSLEE